MAGLIKDLDDKIEETQFLTPFEKWSVELVKAWIHELGDNDDEIWQKTEEIITDKQIDGRTLKEANVQVLVDLGIDKAYAMAIIKARDKQGPKQGVVSFFFFFLFFLPPKNKSVYVYDVMLCLHVRVKQWC